MADTSVFQIDVVHEVVQRDMCVIASHAGHGRKGESGEGRQGAFLGAEAGKYQVEPNHVWLAGANGPEHGAVIG